MINTKKTDLEGELYLKHKFIGPILGSKSCDQ